VAKGEARFEYQDPKEFFSRTYITQGMRSLLMSALKRVSVTDDDDGDPVVELKTAFGGGKTHSMLAVYHLMRTSKIARELPGVAEVMDQARVPSLPDKVYVATLVGTDLDPSSSKNPPFLQGKVNTLWGEMAYQLCLQKGDPAPYAIIRSADSKGVAPGADALKRLFDAIGPCVILMDEFVAYARTLYDNDSKHLPAGTFENLLSFLQQLTEAVKRTENCMLIASLPESERELGGEGGKIALQRVEQIFGRVNSIWRAATNE
jgi:predicted AAA+ superfamily ATPase